MSYIYVEDKEQSLEIGKPRVRLIGTDGNAFAIMGSVRKAMREYQRVDPNYNAAAMFKEYQMAATQGDYDKLLQVTMSWCEIY